MSNIIQNIIDAYHPPPINWQDKYIALSAVSDKLVSDNRMLKEQLKKYEFYGYATVVLLSYAGLVYYFESKNEK